ncbi:hypothetical protein EI969_18325 [Pseudomonas sp. PB101]|uniref:hypothetical protein n=1 Tax=Pseudomonas sp. PB101 TaxID=2495428 RepID=UPI001365626E|nr:hypothetical protein [Pseudomonas sp. PB101]MVW87876.1 hypothetical protein [Pseudomonas sp. PB101]
MRNSLLLLPLLLQVSGCTTFSGPGSDIGWTDAVPPVGNGVGRKVETNHRVKSLGQAAFQVTPDQLEILPTYNAVSTEENTKYSAGANAVFSQITADAKIERSTSNLSQSSDWKIVQLKDFSTVVLDKEFAYKCLTAKEYSYEVIQKTSGNVKLDASKIAQAFGVTAAAVEVSASPDKPNHTKVTIAEPNVCLSFVSATLERARWLTRYDGTRSLRLDGAKKFTLNINEPGPTVEPDFGKRAVQTKPRYQLYAGEAGGKATLNVMIEDRETHQEVPTKILKETLPGVWKQSYKVHTFNVEEDIYAIMSLDIEAKRTADNKIVVTYAELSSPEYKLKRD